MDVKLVLDMEIIAYSGKRKRPNDTDSEASSFAGSAVTRTPITQQASASGQVTVDEVEQDGKYVRLSNKGDELHGTRGAPADPDPTGVPFAP
ncbi:lamin-A-like [Syngnathus typhle]